LKKNEYAPPTPEQAPETTTTSTSSSLGFADSTRLRFRRKFIEERKEEAWFDSDDADDEDYNPKNDTDSVPLPSLQEFRERNKKRGRVDTDDQIPLREGPIKKQKKSTINNGKEKTKERI